MTEARRITNDLTDGTDMHAAALLAAMSEDATLRPRPEDADALAQLEDLDCVSGGAITPLGRQVAGHLRAAGVAPGLD